MARSQRAVIVRNVRIPGQKADDDRSALAIET